MRRTISTCNAADTFSVIASCSNSSSNMRSVVMGNNYTTVIHKVIAVNIINISIVVIINSVTGDFVFIDPQIIFEVFMLNIDTPIYDGNHHISTAGSRPPCRYDINIGTCNRADNLFSFSVCAVTQIAVVL